MISSGWPLSCLPKKTCSVLGRLRVSRPNVRHPSLPHVPGRDGDRDRDSGRRFPGEAGRCGGRSLRVADPRGDPPPPALARQPPGGEADGGLSVPLPNGTNGGRSGGHEGVNREDGAAAQASEKGSAAGPGSKAAR